MKKSPERLLLAHASLRNVSRHAAGGSAAESFPGTRGNGVEWAGIRDGRSAVRRGVREGGRITCGCSPERKYSGKTTRCRRALVFFSG